MVRTRLLLVCALLIPAASAMSSELSDASAQSLRYGLRPLAEVSMVELEALDLDAIMAEDEARESAGLAPRFAIPLPYMITPDADGVWDDLDAETRVWRLRIASPDALSLNLGFTRYFMPPGGQLLIYGADDSYKLQPFTAADNETHGELWTPVVLSDDIVVEVVIPASQVSNLELELTSINVGYRGFGEILGLRSGTCNNDVVCPEGDPWRDEIQSVGVISTGGSLFCTGFAVNNTAEDQTPYFMTAYHCGITSSNAASLVVYWNFQSPNCGDQCCGSLAQNQTGSFFRAGYSTSDFTLVELDSDPNPAHLVSFAGWDRTTADPSSAVGIHHPNTDEKSISFEYDPTSTTSYLGTAVPGDGTHIRITDWDDGTTEPGSSGSPLFSPGHHVVGQLHGGYASCTSQTSDWYGRFSRSWTGGGSNSTRLSNWLDAGGTGANTVDTLVPWAVGMAVTPGTGLESAGNPGGPFTPNNIVYTVENQGDTAFDYSVTANEAWISITNASGTLPASGTVNVTVSINSNANSLTYGTYADTVSFENLTTGEGDTTRPVTLQVGLPAAAYSFPMDTNPGWTTQDQWAFGQPTGGGGEYGGPDPTSGHTGLNVYGYNLAGDYANTLPERHLTSTAIDCSNLSGVTLKFWRWLGVEVSSYDHAYVRVSNNGSTWTTVWQNSAQLAETSWTQVEYDISALADGQATVYLRWTMGTTDGSWRFCGWNIDDVEIWGVGSAGSCSDGILNQDEVRIDCGGVCPACNCTSDGACANGMYCDGAETCDAYGECQAGTAVNCNDGIGCTDDSCNEGTDSCDNVPNDGLCDNGLYCDGAETCDPGLDCQAGTAVNCNDGVGCTDDSCNEGTDSCDNVPNDGLCDNGLYCDGAETCDPGLDCQAGVDPCLPSQTCDEVGDQCLDSCTALTASICRDHSTSGVLCLVVGVANGIEARFGGVTTLNIDLVDAAGFGGGVTVDCTPTAYTGVATHTGTVGNTVTIEFAPGLPDQAACTVTLDCGAQVCVRNLEGDSNGDGVTNAVDNSQKKGLFGETANAGNAQWDVNADGVVNAVDNSQTKGRFGSTAPACP